MESVEVGDGLFLREDRNEVEFLFLKQLFNLFDLLVIFRDDTGPSNPDSSQPCVFLLKVEESIEQDALRLLDL